MKTLIVEDDFTSRLLLQELLKSYGESHVAVNGKEAVEAVGAALEGGEPYDLVCLDIMMPEMDGQEALKRIRAMEEEAGLSGPDRVKIIMTTALSDRDIVVESANAQCDKYIIKPIDKAKFLEVLCQLGLLLSGMRYDEKGRLRWGNRPGD